MTKQEQEREARSVLSLYHNGAFTDEVVIEMLAQTDRKVLAELLLDTFNRVPGCFAFNETFIGED